MNNMKILAIGAVSLACAAPAHASSSAWQPSEGGQIRLVTSGKPDADGRISGVLEIQLKPGWKTYWRDPGGSGVPPQIDVAASANVSAAELSFPAPQRHDDGYGKWAGYDRSVALPVVFTLAAPNDTAGIDANVFLGMCQDICIPVQARLKLDAATDPGNPDDAAVVEAGFAALPSPASAGFGVTTLPGDPDTLVVEAAAPGDPASVDFFVAGEDGYMFAAPSRSERDGKIIFNARILARPADRPGGAGLHYTLTGASGAVQGVLPYP